jgi:hypothetical protein
MSRAFPLITFATFAAFASLVLAPALACTAGTSSTNCALNTCNSGAVIQVYANVTRDVMEASSITACLNGGCVTGAPASIPSSPGDRLSVALKGALVVQGYISSPDPVKGYLVEADFTLGDSSPADGDEYKLAVISNGEAVPGSLDQKVTYEKTTPNGASCPPVCDNVTVAAK